MALEAILVGDMHMDKLRKLYGDRCNELVLAEFDKACEYADENGVPNVVQLGDVSDKSRMSYDAHVRLLTLLNKWDGRLNIFILLGNHDFDEHGINSLQILQTMCDLGMFKTIHIYSKSEQVEIDGVTCNFLAWPNTTPMKSSRQPANFGHFEVAGATGDNGRVLKHGEEVSEKHLFWNGHLHTPHTAGNVHFVGTLCQFSFGERLPKSMTHLRLKYDSTGKRLVVKEKRIEVEPAFKLINVTVQSKRDLKQVGDNPLHLYRLIVEDGVEIPDNWLAEHPNVVKTEGYSTAEEVDQLLAEEWVPQTDDGKPILDERAELEGVLRKDFNLSDKKVARAVNILDTLINQALPDAVAEQ